MELSSLEPVLSVSHKANVDIQVDETVNATAPFEVDTIVITIEAINNGPSNATGVKVTHILPTELTFVSYSVDAGSFDSTTGVWTIGNLLVDEIVTLNITATVDAPAGHTMIYLNDTTASYWEYTSYVDLEAFSSQDCPILIATIDPGTSKNVKLCFIIPKDNSTGYSLIVNNNRYLKNLSTDEFMLEYVPGWFKTTAGAWCDGITTDTEYVEAIEFQINGGTIILLATVSGPDTSKPIPTWIKDNACLGQTI